MNHGLSFNFGCAKVCSPAIFETCFPYDKDIWIAATGSGGYFGLAFATPPPPRVERFSALTL